MCVCVRVHVRARVSNCQIISPLSGLWQEWSIICWAHLVIPILSTWWAILMLYRISSQSHFGLYVQRKWKVTFSPRGNLCMHAASRPMWMQTGFVLLCDGVWKQDICQVSRCELQTVEIFNSKDSLVLNKAGAVGSSVCLDLQWFPVIHSVFASVISEN